MRKSGPYRLTGSVCPSIGDAGFLISPIFLRLFQVIMANLG